MDFFNANKRRINTALQALEHNVFIGGIASETDTIAKLVEELSTDLSGNIENFQIVGSDVYFYTDVSFIPNFNAFRATSGIYPNIVTYFIDPEGKCQRSNTSFMRGQSNCRDFVSENIFYISQESLSLDNVNLKVFYFPNLTSTHPIARWGGAGLRRLYIPNCTNLNSLRSNVDNATIYVHPSLMTSNEGGLDEVLAQRQSEGCTIVPVTNFTPPGKVTNLAVTATGDVTFTQPASTNTLDFYEVQIDDGTNNPVQLYTTYKEITASGDNIGVLAVGTKVKIRACDEFFNRGEFSDEFTITS